jgi:hypothetical protein
VLLLLDPDGAAQWPQVVQKLKPLMHSILRQCLVPGPEHCCVAHPVMAACMWDRWQHRLQLTQTDKRRVWPLALPAAATLLRSGALLLEKEAGLGMQTANYKRSCRI